MNTIQRSPVRQAGAVAFRIREHVLEVLLVRPSNGKAEWLFPKGHVEQAESPDQAALRELREEAGVTGGLVGAVDHVSRFDSKGESVAVRYYIVECLKEEAPMESREHTWLPMTLAAEALTHDENCVVLREAVPIIDAHLAASGRGDSEFREFLRMELKHLTESFFKSEEDGERRVTFFLSLTAGAGALLAFLLGKDASYSPGEIYWPVVLVLGGLLVFGNFVLVRVIKRNESTDQYKENLRSLRKWFTPNESDPRVAWVSFNPFEGKARDRKLSYWGPSTGGWMEILLLVIAILAGALTGALIPTPSWFWESIVSLAGGALAWLALVIKTRRVIDKRKKTKERQQKKATEQEKERKKERRMEWG